MKLSTKARYGLRAMLSLAASESRGSTTVKDIAGRENLPDTYLEQLMMVLRRAGLIRAMRGAKGGYALSRPANEITVAQIVEATEGPLTIADCADVPYCCTSPDLCALKDFFAEVDRAIVEVFERFTLHDLVLRQQAKERENSPAPMYYI